MAMKRRKPSGGIEYKISRAGLLPRPYYRTFHDEAEGDEFARRVEAALDRGIVPEELREGAKDRRRVRERIDAYLADQHVPTSDRACLLIVRGRFPVALELRELTFTWAQAWVTSMKREANLSPQTIRHHVGALARCFDWLVAHGDMTFNPLRMLRRGYALYTPEDARHVRAEGGAPKDDDERDRRFRDGEEAAIRRILAGEKPEGRQRPLELPNAEALRVLFDLALESAMRLREMYTLEKKQIDLDKRTVFLDKTKNGSKRQVPLTSVAVDLLRPYLAKLKGPRVFPWWDGDTDEKALARVTSRLSRQFGRIFAAAGLDDFVFHDLRHEATSRYYERTTIDGARIMKITGHRSQKAHQRYANLRASYLAEQLW